MDVDFTPETKNAGNAKAFDIKKSLNNVLNGKNFPEGSKNRRLLFIGAFTVAAIVCALIGFFIFNKPATNKKVPVMTVTYEEANYHPMKRNLSINGSVSAWDPLSIGAEVNGLRIDSVRVEEGAHVKGGEILATLNSSVLQAQLEQEQARLLASKAAVAKAIQPNRSEDINSLKASLAQAKATVAQEQAMLIRTRSTASNARENANRYSDLAKQGAVSEMEADNKVTEAKAATAEVVNAEKRVEAAHFAQRQAEERLHMAVSGGRYEDVLMSKASLKETEARIKQLSAQIEQTIIRAPDDGQIVKRDAHIGEITSAGKTLFYMVRDNRLELRAQVPEVDLPKIKPGQEVQITAGTESNISFTGKVREISPLVDASTRLGTVRIDIPNSTDIHPGMFFHGEIALGEANVITVPTSAVLSNDEGSRVFILQPDDTVQSRSIQTGEHSDKQVEIKSGLTVGEKVVVLGAGFLKEGDLVRIMSVTK